MIRRLAALAVIAWAIGFMWFAVALPQPAGDEKTDVAVIVTGGEGRIQRGLDVLRRHLAGQILITGVDREVRPRELQAMYGITSAELRCCITLDSEAVDTRTNAREAGEWVRRHKARSVRLITSDWHMRRAAHDMENALPAGVVVVRDAVSSRPTVRTLFLEYHKLIARTISRLWGG